MHYTNLEEHLTNSPVMATFSGDICGIRFDSIDKSCCPVDLLEMMKQRFPIDRSLLLLNVVFST
jgi:hypothetical protein